MPDYRPIPGQTNTGRPSPMNLPTDDLSRMAGERASSLLTPYGDQFGQNRPIVPSPAGGGAGAPPAPASSSMEDKLYQSIHPDTFSKVLETIMQFVTGKPIPRQFGGSAEPGEEYIVGENGPERFRPAVPGQIIPETPSPMGGRSLTYTGGLGLGYESPVERGLRGTRGVIDKISPYVGPAMSVPLKAFAKAGEVMGEGGYPVPETGGGLPPLAAGHGPGAGGGEFAPGHVPGEYPISGGWKDYGEGIRYKLGETGPPVSRPIPTQTPEQLEIAEREKWAQPGYAEAHPNLSPGYQRSYYEAHPEERAAQEFYDMTRGPSASSYEGARERMQEMNLMDIVKDPNTTKEARAAAGVQLTEIKRSRAEREAGATKGAGDIYGKALEHGIGTPGAQEKLAHAEYLRKYPEMHMAGISEQSRAHLEGIHRQVEGHITAAKIAAEVKDPIMKEIGTVLAQGQKMAEIYGTPFDPQKTVGNVLKVYKALGAITDEQWAKIPQEYKEKQWTEQSLKADLKANGMKDKEIEAYIKRAKAAGKV